MANYHSQAPNFIWYEIASTSTSSPSSCKMFGWMNLSDHRWKRKQIQLQTRPMFPTFQHPPAPNHQWPVNQPPRPSYVHWEMFKDFIMNRFFKNLWSLNLADYLTMISHGCMVGLWNWLPMLRTFRKTPPVFQTPKDCPAEPVKSKCSSPCVLIANLTTW